MGSYLTDIVDGIAPRNKPVPDLFPITYFASRVLAQGHRRAYEHYAKGDPTRQRTGSGMCKAIPSIAGGVGVGLKKYDYVGLCVSLASDGACLGGPGGMGEMGLPIRNSNSPDTVMIL